MAVIAHLSDIHIDDERSVQRTRAVTAYLEDLPYDLDLVLVTGDIADHGTPEEYATARGLLASRHPVLVCPGNHDDRAAFRRGLLAEPGSEGPVDQVYRGAGFTVVACDSSVPGKPEGWLGDGTLAWLEEQVAGAPEGDAVLVAFHHPPVALHVPYVDGIRQFGEGRLAELAGRQPRLTAFLAGHAHTAAATTFAGRPLLVGPGVVNTIRLPWERHTHADDHARLDQPPGVAFHVLHEDHRLTTHFRTVSTEG
ncbi:metallophosphoesterase [Streptomyces sp. MAR4 CNX-425]|uniref:metallophosphoesterase n=1 Tax=Streptomyces sp. MAR4 CNX-425 TaxID=3406343 RepID=UPI003B50B664